MRPDNFELGALLLGALLISAGGTLTGVYTFQGQILPVLIGYILFTVGYKVSWYGTHSIKNLSELKNHLHSFEDSMVSHFRSDVRNYFLIVLGLLMSSFGTVRFGSMVVNELKLFEVAWAGVLCFGGYMVAHEGVNEVLV